MAIYHEIQKCSNGKLFGSSRTETISSFQWSIKYWLSPWRQGIFKKLSNSGGTSKISQLQIEIPVKKTVACMQIVVTEAHFLHIIKSRCDLLYPSSDESGIFVLLHSDKTPMKA